MILDGDNLYVARRSPPFVVKFSIRLGRTVTSYTGHTGTAFSIQLFEDYIISGYMDSSILCWNEANGDLVRSFLGQSGFVYVVAIHEGNLYSSGQSRIVTKWNFLNGQVIMSFPYYHSLSILSFAYMPQKLFTGSSDTTVVQWDTNSGEAIYSYKGSTRKLRAVAVWKNFVFGAGGQPQIQIWDSSAKTFDAFSVFTADFKLISCLLVHDKYLFSGSPDSFLRQ